MKRKNDHRAPGADPIAKLKGRRRRRAALASVVAASFTLLSSAAPASDVNSSMDTYWSSSLGSANVTGPTAFQGQSAGRYPQINTFDLYLSQVHHHPPVHPVSFGHGDNLVGHPVEVGIAL